MESVTRKKIFIIIAVVLILVGIVIYVKKKKSSSNNRIIDKAKVPVEVLTEVKNTHEHELLRGESFEGDNNFPLVLGSEGDNVNRLQRALGIKETGVLDKKTLTSFEHILKDMGLQDLSKVSEASLILIEAYSEDKDTKDFIEGDIVIANDPNFIAQRVNIRRNPKGSIFQLQPTKDYKRFKSGEKLGVIAKKMNDDHALIKNDLGDFYVIEMNKVKKK